MNALLLYNDNISIKLINEFEEKGGIAIYFKIGNQDLANPNFSFDKNVSEKLAAIENKQFDAIFLPFSLSEENYIEFLGIQFAYHIRLTPSFNNIHTPIVFFGNETPEIINKITNQGVILFTSGIFCKQISTVLNFEEQLNLIKSKKPRITEGEYKTFLERIQVTPPANYSNRHSIANEWSILRWAKYLNDYDLEIRKIEEKIGTSLYFKYLNSKLAIQENCKENIDLQLKNSGKILYIDDEVKKGWDELFSYIFLDINRNIVFEPFGYDFKSWDKEIDIIPKSIEKAKDYDVVILDLRLHDDDFDELNPKKISGFQILEEIKKHNKGIQVIIFSATNKIWNLQALQEAGADGFIIKESPENSIDPNFTRNSIQNIFETVDKCLEMKFLKGVYINIEKIKNHLNSISNKTNDVGFDGGLMKMKFKNEIYIQLNIIFDCLRRLSDNISTEIEDDSSYLNLSFTSIYKIIELINDFYTDETGGKLKSNSQNVQRYNQDSDDFSRILKGYPSARDKIYTIIKFELNDEPSNYVHKFNKFNNDRTNITHPKTLKDYKKTSVDENVKFLSLITDLLMKIN